MPFMYPCLRADYKQKKTSTEEAYEDRIAALW